ncbi:MAG: SBBP repeat-containing protein [Flavobacteriales bacterium]|nr:SBBP repeat-containing protein [Flavobacteriales bacterium]
MLWFTTLHAQNFEWAKQMGASNSDVGVSITNDKDGNVYTTGIFWDNADFDPSTGTYYLNSNGVSDVFVSKLNDNGEFVWAKSIGGIDYDEVYSICTDVLGNVYITGYFNDVVDFDPGIGVYNLTSVFGRDIFVLKLDANGEFVWAKQMGGSSNDIGYDITIDSIGNVFVTGYFQSTVDFNPGAGTFNLTSGGAGDAFILKLDNAGNFIWAKKLGGNNDCDAKCIKVDNDGNLYISGIFSYTSDFDPSPSVYNLSTSGSDNSFIVKLDELGNFVWAKQIGGENMGSYLKSLVVDNFGNVYSTGYFADSADFDPGVGDFNLESNGGNDIFVLKLDSFGNFEWVKQIGGIQHDEGYSIDIDKNGNPYIIGVFLGTVDFDPGSGFNYLNAIDNADIFILKLDVNGDLAWVNQYTSSGPIGSGYVGGNSIKIGNVNEIYSTGFFTYTVDFDHDTTIYNLNTSSYSDIFVLKMNQCSTRKDSISPIACDYYISPSGNYLTTSGVYNDTIFNSIGCDSIITINLTINSVDTIVINNSPTLIANAAGANYQWLDCDNGNLSIIGAINQSFTPVTNGNYSVEVTQNGCVDTSSCFPISVVSIIENELSNDLFLFPNPTMGNVTLRFPIFYNELTVILRNYFGKEILQKKIYNTNEYLIEIKGNPGIYLIELRNELNQIVHLRVIKQ